MKCRFIELTAPDENGKRRCKCVRCGLTTAPTGSPLDRIHAKCQAEALGDWLSYLLQAIGITAATYVAWKRWGLRLIGRPEAAEKAACGCEGRRDWLNEVSHPWIRSAQLVVARAKWGARKIAGWF